MDRHGLRPRDDKGEGRNGSRHNVVIGRRTTRQSIVSRGTRAGLSVRLVKVSRSPRPQGARDDKSGVDA